jgi:hypothetical protein
MATTPAQRALIQAATDLLDAHNAEPSMATREHWTVFARAVGYARAEDQREAHALRDYNERDMTFRGMSLERIVSSMETYGGGFVSALSIAFRRADMSNRRRIVSVFGDVLDRYHRDLTQLDAQQASAPKVPFVKAGDRVRFVGRVERGMEFSLDLTGEFGTVMLTHGRPANGSYCWVQLDKKYRELESWDNAVQMFAENMDEIEILPASEAKTG